MTFSGRTTTSCPASGNTFVLGSQCPPGIDVVMAYFKDFFDQTTIDINVKKDELYMKKVEEKWGLKNLVLNDKGGFTISWEQLVQTYCSQTDGCGT